MEAPALVLAKLCAKEPKEIRARSKGHGLVCVRADGIPKGASSFLAPPDWSPYDRVRVVNAVS
jgi:hypothetical protein